MAKPVALAGAAIVRPHSILPATLISLNGAGIDPDGDPITAYQWTLLDRPPGSAAALVDDTTTTPDLTPDLPGTYLCFLAVQAGAEWSEAHGPLAPDSAYCAVVVTTRYQALRIPGAGERAWAPHLYDALLKIDTLAGLIGTGGGGQSLFDFVKGSQQVQGDEGTLAIGQFRFDPAWIAAGKSIKFCAVGAVSEAANTGTILLYNLTDAEAVTGASLSVTGSLDFSYQESAALTVGAAAGNLKNAAKVYEVRISTTGGDPSDLLTLTSAYLEVY